MFTGIVQAVGRIRALESRGGDLRLLVDCAALPLERTRVGDSIAVNGVCLTAVTLGDGQFAADVSRETLSCTTLGAVAVGARVNLEPALRVGDALGGHLVSGHVDGIGAVRALADDARSRRVKFAAPRTLLRYLAPKGSVTVDGVSLTINESDAEGFGVNLVPHTLAATNFDELAVGRAVNLEIDPIARYVEQLLGSVATAGREPAEH